MTTNYDYTLALLDSPDQDDLEAQVAALPAEAVPQVLAWAVERAKQLRQVTRMLESRMIVEAVIGEAFTAADGKEWQWITDRKRVCSDPDELKSLLLEQSKEWSSTIAKRALLRAFRTKTDVLILELDQIEKWEPLARPLIHEYVAYQDGYPHLKPVKDEE